MRILFIGPLPDPITGQSLACDRLLRHLRRRHEVEVINIRKLPLRQGITSISRIRDVLSFARKAARLARWADVIYLTCAQSLAGNFRDLLLYRALGERIRSTLIHLHGGAGMRALMSGRYPLLPTINAAILRKAGGIVVLGESLRDIFASVPDVPIHVVPNFADKELFVSGTELEDKLRDLSRLRVVFLSNLIPGKGHFELLRAFAKLDPTHRARVEVRFAGAFESEAAKEAFLAEMAGEPSLHYEGVVAGGRKRTLLAEAHVFCLPTYYPYEGQPISLLEAYAAGCAVITTQHGGIVDVFEDGVNGWAVAPRSEDAVAAALTRALLEPDATRAFARRNRKVEAVRFDVDVFANRLEDLLCSVAGR